MTDHLTDVLTVILLAAIFVAVAVAVCRIAGVADTINDALTDREHDRLRADHYAEVDDFAARLAHRQAALVALGDEADNVFPLRRDQDAVVIQFPGGTAA